MTTPSRPVRTRVKICGITDEEALFAAADAGADAVGFNFHPKSRRFIQPEDAFELISLLPPFVTSVGLFVDASVDRFSDIEEVCPTDMTQLHGDESEATVRACGPSLIKAVRFDPSTIQRELARWDALDEVDAILVDGSAGGQGVAFDWAALAPLVPGVRKPIILAGGLTPDNVGAAIRAVRPYGVDVSSGVESEPGVKDRALMAAFCAAVRTADAG
jgi:phosphoribosylanthranilate isomerase